MKTRVLGILGVVTVMGVSMVWLGSASATRASAAEEKKCILFAPEGYPDKTNCPECLKDSGDKKEGERFRASGTITKDFSKNLYYVQPPSPLGDGHALKIDLTAPGNANILSVSRGCYGEGCGWTHDVTYQNMGTKTVTWIGWSNAGTNCILTFTITYQ